jgi:hypothetical protein
VSYSHPYRIRIVRASAAHPGPALPPGGKRHFFGDFRNCNGLGTVAQQEIASFAHQAPVQDVPRRQTLGGMLKLACPSYATFTELFA